MKVLGNDERPITGIYGPLDEWSVQVTSLTTVQKIEAYFEDGDTVWFAVFIGDEIKQRINSKYVESVTY